MEANKGKRLDSFINTTLRLKKSKQTEGSRKAHFLLQVVTTIFSWNHPGSSPSSPQIVPLWLVPGRAS